ncbi:hypothetical protein CROQUDRAFT_35337, partial [Cronartium quercuum f. sp. fusiforme G11]
HRHSSSLNHLLSLLTSLTQSHPTPPHQQQSHSSPRKSLSSTSRFSQQTNHSLNLEPHPWNFIASRQHVRLYTRDLNPSDHFPSHHPQQSILTTPQAISLPFFRGEGWIHGSWRSDDIGATLNSLPARAIWDPKMDLSKSSVYQILDSDQAGDQLFKLTIKHKFPIGTRDQCLVSGYRPYGTTEGSEPSSYSSTRTKDQGGVWLCTSVVDDLVPELDVNTRSFGICALACRPRLQPPSYSPHSITSTPRVVSQPDTSPIRPPSFRSNQISSTNTRSSTSGHNPADLPSIVKRLSLTVSPVNAQLIPIPASVGPMSGVSAEGSPITPTKRLSKNLSEMNWPSPTSALSSASRRMSIVSPVTGSDRRISTQSRRTSINFSSPTPDLISSITPTSSIRRHRASSMLSTTSPVHYASTLCSASSVSKTGLEERDSASPLSKTALEERDRTLGPGIHVSLVLRWYHGNKVPLSFVQYGFAPHLSRENSPKGIKILGEEFDPTHGFYKIQYTVKQPANGETRIRFHGATFTSTHSTGHYEVVVMRASQWTLVYDQPSSEAVSDKENLRKDQSPPDSLHVDRARLTSWRGGCTIVIIHPQSSIPVEVQIRKIGNLSTSLPSSTASGPLRIESVNCNLRSSERMVLGSSITTGYPDLVVGNPIEEEV